MPRHSSSGIGRASVPFKPVPDPIPELVISRIVPDNPPLQFSGDVLVTLDVEGRLVSFQGIPPAPASSAASSPAPDWTLFFAEAGLDFSQWTLSDARQSPFTFADTRTAWQGPPSNKPGRPSPDRSSGIARQTGKF